MTLAPDASPVTPAASSSGPVADPTPPTGTPAVVTLTAEELEKRERDLKAQTGREIKAARDEAQRARQENAKLQAEVQQVRTQLEQHNKVLSQQQEMALQEKLSKLPEGQRALEEVRILKEQLAAERQRPRQVQQPRQMTDSELEELINQRSKAYVEQINKVFELEEGQVLSEDDRKRLVDETDTEEQFVEAARKLARARLRGEAPVTKNQTPTQPTPAAPQPVDPAQIAKDAAAEVLKSLGVTGSITPRPTGGAVLGGSEELRKVGTNYDPTKGPKATLAQLRAIREEAANKVSIVKSK